MATETALRDDEWTQVIENTASSPINVTLQPRSTATYIWSRASSPPSNESVVGFRWIGSDGMFVVDLQPGASLWMRLGAPTSGSSAIVTWEV